MKKQTKLVVRLVLLVTVLATVFFVGVLAASAAPFASHNFPDVLTSAFYHNAVEWIFNRNITAGCGGGLYCPNNSVTRGEMAVFMQKLGIALTPVIYTTTDGGGAVDPDAGPILCTAGIPGQISHTVGVYPQQAMVNGAVSLYEGGAMSFTIYMVYSTDGGTSWTIFTPNFERGGGDVANYWAHASHNKALNLSPGLTYIFGIQVGRAGIGTADATDYRCDLTVQVFNRNGTSSPLDVEQEGPSDAHP